MVKWSDKLHSVVICGSCWNLCSCCRFFFLIKYRISTDSWRCLKYLELSWETSWIITDQPALMKQLIISLYWPEFFSESHFVFLLCVNMKSAGHLHIVHCHCCSKVYWPRIFIDVQTDSSHFFSFAYKTHLYRGNDQKDGKSVDWSSSSCRLLLHLLLPAPFSRVIATFKRSIFERLLLFESH